MNDMAMCTTNLARINMWLCANRLLFKIDMTSYVVFSNKSWADDQYINIRKIPIAHKTGLSEDIKL